MCGIVGYIGRRQAAPILLSSLEKLEYRGSDSAGLAVRDGENPAEVVKATGKLKNLAEKTGDGTIELASAWNAAGSGRTERNLIAFSGPLPRP